MLKYVLFSRTVATDSRVPPYPHPRHPDRSVRFGTPSLLWFHFLAQSVISAIASHVPDVVVRCNVDPFLARLSTPVTFADVFELADAHSDMMDDVLSACLLHSNQLTAGDALRGCMELAHMQIVRPCWGQTRFMSTRTRKRINTMLVCSVYNTVALIYDFCWLTFIVLCISRFSTGSSMNRWDS